MLCLGAVLWLSLVIAGMGVMLRYQNSPGKAARSSAMWPQQSALARSSNHFTLVMLAHPRCPCTRASVSELTVLMTRLQGEVSAFVIFFKPGNVSEQWVKTDLWANSSRIPGVAVLADENGVEAKRFGAETSGQTLLYDRSGHLLFKGGITGGRGHPGDNAGRRAILAVISAKAGYREGPVFGCSLISSNANLWKESLCCRK